MTKSIPVRHPLVDGTLVQRCWDLPRLNGSPSLLKDCLHQHWASSLLLYDGLCLDEMTTPGWQTADGVPGI